MKLHRWVSSYLIALAVTNVAAHAQESTTYRYDSLGRLVQVSVTGNPTSNTSSTYRLDPAGNRTNVTVAPTTAPAARAAQARAQQASQRWSDSGSPGRRLAWCDPNGRPGTYAAYGILDIRVLN